MPKNDEFWRNRVDDTDRLVDELIGIAQGVLIDGVVDQKEAEFIKTWLERNGQYHPIFEPLMKQIGLLLDDGYLDDDEAASLKDTLTSITGGFGDGGEEHVTTLLPLDSEPRTIEVQGSAFALTGTFNRGTRKTVTAEIVGMGAEVLSNVNRRTDYLVLGHYVTPAWKHKSYGRKIERAMEYRDSGTGIMIVSERDLWP